MSEVHANSLVRFPSPTLCIVCIGVTISLITTVTSTALSVYGFCGILMYSRSVVDLLLGDWSHFSLLDLLDDPGLLHFDSVDDVLFHEALRLLCGQQLQRTALRYHVRFHVCVNTWPRSKHVCIDACLCRFVVCRKSPRVGHPRPSLSGTGVPWVSCLEPLVCPRVQDDPEAKSQPVVVLVGVLRWCEGRGRGRGREKRVCVQLRILKLLLDWKRCSSSQSHSFLVISSVSFVPSVPLVPSRIGSKFSEGVSTRFFLHVCPQTRHLDRDLIDFLACCLQCRNPSCSR